MVVGSCLCRYALPALSVAFECSVSDSQLQESLSKQGPLQSSSRCSLFLPAPSLSCGTGGKRPSCSQGAGRISLTSQEDGDHSCPLGTIIVSWPEPGGAAHGHQGGISGRARALPRVSRSGRGAPCVLTDSQDAWPHILFSAVWVFVLAEPGSRS